MKLLKTVLKSVAGLVIGFCVGFIPVMLVVVLFTDKTFADFRAALLSLNVGEGVTAALVGVASMLVSIPVLVTIHELGHLVCGLLTGYRFVSFRIFNLTFIRESGRLRIKRFAVAGTGGQCLMSPPDLPLEKIPVGLYNAGGIIANLLVLAVVVPLLWCDLTPFMYEFTAVFIIIDVIMILMNGIPVRNGKITNDAGNILLLGSNLRAKRAVMTQLRANAMIQNGVRPKDMPDGWFHTVEEIDYRNALEVSVPMMSASRLVDMQEWEAAYDAFEELYRHKSEIMPLYVLEIKCELLFLALITGRGTRAEELLDDELMKYIRTYGKVMSSKERVLCAVALYIWHDRDKALAIRQKLYDARENYLLQGEIKSDLALMSAMLGLAEGDSSEVTR